MYVDSGVRNTCLLHIVSQTLVLLQDILLERGEVVWSRRTGERERCSRIIEVGGHCEKIELSELFLGEFRSVHLGESCLLRACGIVVAYVDVWDFRKARLQPCEPHTSMTRYCVHCELNLLFPYFIFFDLVQGSNLYLIQTTLISQRCTRTYSC